MIDLHARAIQMLAESQRLETADQLVRDEQVRYREFKARRDLALERDAEFAAFDMPTSLQATRQAAWDALTLYGSFRPSGQ